MKPNVYLDIDGVLLANENNAANYSDDFIKYVVTNFPTYWLTTHCMDGRAATAVEHIAHLFKPETVELMQKIRGTAWSIAKTEAIDFSKPFIWFDDDLYSEELRVLHDYKALDNWIEVDLAKDEDQLAKFINSFPLAVQPTPIALQHQD